MNKKTRTLEELEKRCNDLDTALCGMFNLIYTQQRLGEKQQQLYELGYKTVDIELMTRHLDNHTRYELQRAYKLLHEIER